MIILGARAESSLPPHVWQQLSHLFPSNVAFHIFFIGPEVAFTHAQQGGTVHNTKETSKYGHKAATTYVSEQLSLTAIQARYEQVHDSLGPLDPYKLAAVQAFASTRLTSLTAIASSPFLLDSAFPTRLTLANPKH